MESHPQDSEHTKQKRSPTAVAGADPITILSSAIKAVPSLKYALAAAGLVAAVAIVLLFGLSPLVALIGALVMLVFMVALVIFARVAKLSTAQTVTPAIVLMWYWSAVSISSSPARIFEGDLLEHEDRRRSYGEHRFVGIGEIDGEVFALVYTWRDVNRRIISARHASRRERDAYRQAFGQRNS